MWHARRAKSDEPSPSPSPSSTSLQPYSNNYLDKQLAAEQHPRSTHTHTHMYTCKHRHTHRHTQVHTYSAHSTSTCFASFISPTSYNVLQFCLPCVCTVCVSVCVCVSWCVPVCVLCVCVNFCGTLIQLGSPRPLSINFSKTRLIAQRAHFFSFISVRFSFFSPTTIFLHLFLWLLLLL